MMLIRTRASQGQGRYLIWLGNYLIPTPVPDIEEEFHKCLEEGHKNELMIQFIV